MTRDLRQLGMALLIALASVGLVIGGLSLSLAESPASPSPTSPRILSATPQVMTPTPTLPPTMVSATATLSIATAPINTATIMATNIASNTPFPSQTVSYPSPTQTNSYIACGPPFDWVHTYIVQPGDTLFHIAYIHYTTTYALQKANCKGGSTIIYQGERLWVPSVAPRAPSATAIPVSPTPYPYPTDPLTETPLPFTLTPDPTESAVPMP